jgi:diguanylate cyclase (GGDEF)-like protein
LLSDISDIIWTIIDHKRTEEKIQGLQAKLQEMAIHDSLTGLHNRYHLDETLERELARAERDNYPIGFIMIDIDHFKQVNDSFGHQAGDSVLQKLAAQLLEDSRAGDILYRYGGEEFLAVLPQANAEFALRVAEKWRKSFQESSVLPKQEDGKVTISCGIAAYPVHGETGAELIASSDQALYRAKTGSRFSRFKVRISPI